MNLCRMNSAVVTAILTSISAVAMSHPSVSGNEHPHNATTVKWEQDGNKDGSSPHNHYDPLPYPGVDTYIQPATFGACWDNSNVRVDSIPPSFDKAHCFVNEAAINGTPGYYFSGSWNSSAKQRVRDAFETFNAILLLSSGYQMGMGFTEVSSSSLAEIIVTYDSCPNCVNGGTVLFNQFGPQQFLKFDSDLNWSFQQSKSGIPTDKWHFFSVALHEIGHVAGLDHQPAGDLNDIMNSPTGNVVGAPLSQNGRHFDEIDNDSVIGLARLYTQPIPAPGPTSASALFLGCHQPGCALWRFEFSAENAAQYRIQSSPYAFGPWSTWAVTSNNTYFPHLAQNPRYFRIRGENSVGSGPWQLLYTTGQCGDGGPGGGGPLD